MSRDSINLPKHMVPCFLCKRDFQFGPNRYAGRGIGAWDVLICEMCEGANHDGVVLASHPDLVAHLAAQGVEIKLNRRGWLSIPQ